MRLSNGLWVAALCTSVWALHESEVGVVDWHRQYIGVPSAQSPKNFPIFYGDLIVTTTENRVLAALNATDGSVVWRNVLKAEDDINFFQVQDDLITLLSGRGGAMLRTFDVSTGNLLLETQLHPRKEGKLQDSPDIGVAVVLPPNGLSDEGPSSKRLVLANGHTLRYMDIRTGEVFWKWTSVDTESVIVYSEVIADPTTIFLVGLADLGDMHTVIVTTISPSSGEFIASVNIPSAVSGGFRKMLTLKTDAQDGSILSCVAWLDENTIKAAILKPDLKGQLMSMTGAEYMRIIDVGLSGQFVGQKEDGTAQLINLLKEESTLQVMWEFRDSATSHSTSASIYTGGRDRKGDPSVSRVYWSFVHNAIVYEVLTTDTALGKGSVSGFTFEYATDDHGVIDRVIYDAGRMDGNINSTRALLVTNFGAIQLWEHEKMIWHRDESLANIRAVKFVELPEAQVIGSHVEEDGLFGLLTRQLSDAQKFPQYLINFIKRFATGSYASVSASPPALDDSGHLVRDAFGFRQIILVATNRHKIFAIDSSTGNILWRRTLGMGWTGEIGAIITPADFYILQSKADGGVLEVVLLTQRRASNSLVDTVLYHFNALTGEEFDVELQKWSSRFTLEGIDFISGPLIGSFLLSEEHRMMVLVDEYLQVHIYPETAENLATFEKLAPSVNFPLRTEVPGQKRIAGHRVGFNTDVSQYFMGYATWSFAFDRHEDIIATIRSSSSLVASIGKVLGNRSTLYKYLNPHLLAVVTKKNDRDTSYCSIYLLDSVKGTIVYQVTIPDSTAECRVRVKFTENWLVYEYFDADFAGAGKSKGHRIVSVELYEGRGPDDKTKSSETTSYSNKTVEVTAYEQSYVLSDDIKAFAFTSTKYGISSKDLVVATGKNSIHSIPRKILNPRRPLHKPSSEELEEGLIQYDSVIPDDPRLALSHNYEVANVYGITTAPALLESTSIVFAYGIDLFCTRVAPSGLFDVLSESFNKTQLVFTVLGLTIAIVVTRPMVRRKRLRERWYQ